MTIPDPPHGNQRSVGSETPLLPLIRCCGSASRRFGFSGMGSSCATLPQWESTSSSVQWDSTSRKAMSSPSGVVWSPGGAGGSKALLEVHRLSCSLEHQFIPLDGARGGGRTHRPPPRVGLSLAPIGRSLPRRLALAGSRGRRPRDGVNQRGGWRYSSTVITVVESKDVGFGGFSGRMFRQAASKYSLRPGLCWNVASVSPV